MNTSIEEKAAPAVLTHEMSDPEMFVSLLQGFRESQNPGVTESGSQGRCGPLSCRMTCKA